MARVLRVHARTDRITPTVSSGLSTLRRVDALRTVDALELDIARRIYCAASTGCDGCSVAAHGQPHPVLGAGVGSEMPHADRACWIFGSLKPPPPPPGKPDGGGWLGSNDGAPEGGPLGKPDGPPDGNVGRSIPAAFRQSRIFACSCALMGDAPPGRKPVDEDVELDEPAQAARARQAMAAPAVQRAIVPLCTFFLLG